jgi:peroxiredoxin
MAPAPAPELDVAGWVNSAPLTLSDLRGTVVLLEAFQMLCPGCVTHGVPQAQRVHRQFGSDDLAVIGIHTVFEHHESQGPEALRVFLSEFRITFPVAIDRPVDRSSIPATMRAYELQGTPSQVLLDRAGRIRSSTLGPIDDLDLGLRIGRLLAERPEDPTGSAAGA